VFYHKLEVNKTTAEIAYTWRRCFFFKRHDISSEHSYTGNRFRCMKYDLDFAQIKSVLFLYWCS